MDSTIANNTTLYAGGGIEWYQNSGALVIRNSTLSGNVAGTGTEFGAHGGGALYAENTYGHIQIIQSTISGNSASGEGGAVWFASYYGLEIVQSTITANSATTVGGIYMPPPVVVPKSSAHDPKTSSGAQADDQKNKKGGNAKAASHRAPKLRGSGVHKSANADIAVTLVGTILAKDIGFDIGSGGTLTASSSLIGAGSGHGVRRRRWEPHRSRPAPGGARQQRRADADPGPDRCEPGHQHGPGHRPDVPGQRLRSATGFPRVTNGRVDIGAYETPQVVVILPTFTG